MAKIFLITYDLKRLGQNYTELYDTLKSLGDWSHPLESVWAVKVENSSAGEIYRAVRPKLDDGDRLFVVEITGADRNGWLPKSFWTWLRQQ